MTANAFQELTRSKQLTDNLCQINGDKMVFDIVPHEDADPLEIYDRNCILIIAGDPHQLDRLDKCFSRQGFKVIAHTRGDYGLQAAQNAEPDCVLIDLHLMDMCGIDLCRKIEDDSKTCHIPSIMIGQAESSETIRDARRAGCQFFLSKPYDPNALLLMVNESIAEARSWICE